MAGKSFRHGKGTIGKHILAPPEDAASMENYTSSFIELETLDSSTKKQVDEKNKETLIFISPTLPKFSIDDEKYNTY